MVQSDAADIGMLIFFHQTEWWVLCGEMLRARQAFAA